MGQYPHHPRMLLRLLMWGMANRVVSTRRIEVMARRDASFIYLAGGQRPSYRTLSRFRRRNAGEVKRLFRQTMLLCARLKMPEKQAVYRKRKWVAEQKIGQIKEGMGFRGATMRGEVYARAQWLLARAVHNLLKAVRFIARLRRQEVVPATN